MMSQQTFGTKKKKKIMWKKASINFANGASTTCPVNELSRIKKRAPPPGTGTSTAEPSLPHKATLAAGATASRMLWPLAEMAT
jgi:hypothetical protein